MRYYLRSSLLILIIMAMFACQQRPTRQPIHSSTLTSTSVTTFTPTPRATFTPTYTASSTSRPTPSRTKTSTATSTPSASPTNDPEYDSYVATLGARMTQVAGFPPFPEECNPVSGWSFSPSGNWSANRHCYMPDPTLVVMNKSGTLKWELHYADYAPEHYQGDGNEIVSPENWDTNDLFLLVSCPKRRCIHLVFLTF